MLAEDWANKQRVQPYSKTDDLSTVAHSCRGYSGDFTLISFSYFHKHAGIHKQP